MNSPSRPHIRPRDRLLHYAVLLTLLLSLLPSQLFAAPLRATNACPASPSGLTGTPIERTDFCVYFDPAATTTAQATTVADYVQNYWNRYVNDFSFRVPMHTGKLAVEILNNAGCNGSTTSASNEINLWSGCFGTTESPQKVSGHELFHRVQFAYDTNFAANWWMTEGTARAMEDLAFDNIDHWATALTAVSSSFNKQVNEYLSNTNADITSQPQRYNSALWWKYFTEQFGTTPGEPQYHVDAMRRLWEAAETQDDIAAVNAALGNLGAGVDFDAAFRRFAAANWIKDLTNQPSAAYNYIDEDEVGNPAPYGPIAPTNGGTINVGASATFNGQTINRYGARYYVATPGATCPLVNATFHTGSGPAFFHVITQKGNTLDSFRSSTATDFSQSFFNDGLTKIVAIAGATDNNATADITLQCANPTLSIKLPNSGAHAFVGTAAGPGKFLAQVLVTNGNPKGPVISGLTINDFQATVNGIPALITGGGFIQEQYWLEIQAPVQASDGAYDLAVSLEKSGTSTVIATATNPTSVTYNGDHLDHVLIIDRSGSMSVDGKMDAARNAAKFYVDITRNNDGVTVVPFSTNVNPAPFPMTKVAAVPNVRQNAKDYINTLTASGATSIGAGAAEGVNQRTSSPTGNTACSFVLMSDGMENTAPMWASVQASVVATGCPVTTIAFGKATDETLLQNIATATGGLYFYNDVYVSGVNAASATAATAANNTELSMDNTYEYAQADSENRQRLLNETGIVPATPVTHVGPSTVQTHTLTIDSSVGEAVFSLTWPGFICIEGCPPGLQMKLVQPDGTVIDNKTQPYTFYDYNSGHLGWRIKSPMAGQWKLLVDNADNGFSFSPTPYQVIVSGQTNINVQLLLPDKLDTRYLTGNRVPIRAFVSGEKPLGGLDVVATVTAPDGTKNAVKLFDDGNHDDGAANDGYYTGYYRLVNQANQVSVEDPRPNVIPNEGSYMVRAVAHVNDTQREALGSFAVVASPDANQNGLPDSWEQENGITNPDADNDLDGLDNLSEYQLGTDPNNSDTDGGGENDGSEYNHQQDPANPKDDQIMPPAFFRVRADVAANVLNYDVRKGYNGLWLWRSEAPTGPWIIRTQQLPLTGVYTDTAENGKTYSYKLMALDANDHRSAIIDSTPVKPSQDPFAPEARILVNNDAAATDSLNVTLTFAANDETQDLFKDITEMKLSNKPDLSDAKYQPFAQNVAWTLDANTKAGALAKVYGQFRDAAGNESLITLGQIRYLPTTGQVPVDQIDPKLRRKAAQFIEQMRGGPLAPGWDNVELGPLATPLYRPDLADPAYYEFLVVDASQVNAAASVNPTHGFIMLSTADHDFPIAHWNFTGESPTQALNRMAGEAGKQAAKFFKLDSLAYAAEDANGDRVATLGNDPLKVTGATTDWLSKTVDLSGSTWQTNQATSNDNDPNALQGKLTKTGPESNQDLKFEAWDSWQSLKSNFKQVYNVYLQDLHNQAAVDWQIDQFAEQTGEGLHKGDVYTLTLLTTDPPTIALSGDGANPKYIKTETLNRAPLPAALRITVLDAEKGQALPLNVTITYPTVNAAGAAPASRTEVVKFAIVGEAPTAQNQIFLPLVNKGGGQSQVDAASVQATNAVHGAWGPWTYYWAGTHGAQRLYNQMSAHTGPNTSDCASGCGGTAWAMLFGWADKQAADGNGYWAGRWGLYRQNGGRGNDAVAPASMDDGVRNMTWEIRNDVGTFCAFGSGPTTPWSMDGASNYLNGRTGTRLDTHYNVLGIHEDRLRDYARNSIRDRGTPAIIGTGWLNHYPLAYGYAWQSRTVHHCFLFWCWDDVEYNRWFYVNEGHGGGDNGWVGTGTWFAGEIYP
ncbi:MAG: VWA domain-containing protein [Caldilineaceae bacterium]